MGFKPMTLQYWCNALIYETNLELVTLLLTVTM